ncbi:MAG: HAD hydrolase-like protein [Burkholderiales bacterium]
MIRNITGKNASYSKVFLDLDGTVTDSGPGCINGVRYMFDKIGYAENDENRIRGFMGPPVKRHLVREYGFSEEEAAAAYVHYREYYDNIGVYENYPYDGIEQAIASIRDSGKKVYIATSKPEKLALLVLEKFGLLGLFSGVFTALHDKNIFDKNEVLANAVAELGDVTGAVMVGDRCFDILGGRHVGFDTVGVLYGYGSKDELTGAGCDYIVDTVHDLAVLLGRA